MTWLIPLAITVASFWWARSKFEKPMPYGGHLMFNLLLLLVAGNVSGLAWFIWAVLT